MKLVISFTLSLCLSVIVSAQKESVTAEAVFIGIAQPTAVKLPLPEYPTAAKKADLAGRVSVAVSIDDHGKIKDVGEADGPYPVCQGVTDPNVLELRIAAVAAAKRAVFNAAIIGQTSIPAKGRITYLFSLDQDSAPVTNATQETDTTRSNTFGVKLANDAGSGNNPSANPKALPKTVSGGVLNGRAISLTKPIYPAAARAIHAGGTVAVQVLILENGTVYSAPAVSGHPLLRTSSEIAACNSKFPPTLLSGIPVRVSGVITYNYVP